MVIRLGYRGLYICSSKLLWRVLF